MSVQDELDVRVEYLELIEDRAHDPDYDIEVDPLYSPLFARTALEE